MDNNDPIICFCRNVKKSDVVNAVNNGHTTFSQVAKETFISSGCGACVTDVLKIMEVAKKNSVSDKQ